jgi:hypothetical protein
MSQLPHLDPLVSTGLISRHEALASGVPAGQLRARLRRGEWRTVRPGWFVPREEWEQLDVYLGRPRLQILAAHRSLIEPHAVSHVSAAAVLGLPFLKPREQLIHVTKLKGPRTRVRAGIKHHQARCLIPVVEEVSGLPVLTPARTSLDIAREDGFDAGVVVIDAVRHGGTTLEELERHLDPMRHWPHVSVVREALAFSDPGSESAGESLMRILVDELQLGLPMETQFELRDSTGWARCDLRVGRHVFEFDGGLKYRSPERGGVAATDGDRVLMAEKQRHDWVCGFHLGMSRVVWDDLWGIRRQRTKARLRREFEATVARFGTDVGDLAPYRVHRHASCSCALSK